MEKMKVIKISEETHEYLMLQRIKTGVPAGRQIDKFVRELKDEEKSSEGSNIRRSNMDD
jgi:hypothetical protein